MTTTFRTNGGDVTISFDGRLDTATSAETNAKINRELEKIGTIDTLTCDASRLEYISSSGLRILLALAKRYKGFRVMDVQPQVYAVLETTGFTKIMTVGRGMRHLSVEGCRLIGIGGVGKVYRLDGDTIIKVFREGTTMDEVRREISLSKEAFVLGMPTAISFDIVKVAPSSEVQTESYGLVYELLKAKTLSTYLKQHPSQLDACARKYADLFRELHQIEVAPGGVIPSAIEHERQQVEYISRYLPQESIDKASLCFTLPHTPGSLAHILTILSFYEMNLTRIQSLPIPGKEWQYFFYADIKFASYGRYQQALAAVRPLIDEFQILGEYKSAL